MTAPGSARSWGAGPSCRTARLWLQDPRDLGPLDAELLNGHLLTCPACEQLRRRQLEVDHRIHDYLSAVSSGESVRAQVRQHLLQGQISATQRPRGRGPGIGRFNLSRRLRPVWISAPLLLIMGIAALLAPQVIPGDETRLQIAAAPWSVPRMNIGYPLAVDPSRPDHLLVGASGQVYESWNAGGSWQALAPLPSDLIIQAVAVDRLQPDRYLVATKHSIYVSRDRGRHWTLTADSLPGAMNMFLIQDPRGAGAFYLGPSVLWKSVDHGETWFRPGRGTIFAPYGIQALAAGRGSDLWTGIWGGGVALSRDGGQVWQRRARGLAPHVVNVAVASDGAVWAATDQGLYTSRDRGLHWHHSPVQGRFYATGVLALPGYLLAGGHGALYRSDDAGAHWRLSMSGLPLDPYVYGLVADPHHPGRIFASLDSDGVFRSDDGGRHWKSVDTGLPSTSTAGKSSTIFFRRYGALWHTNTQGSDPGVLTVDQDVTRAALSPDGAAVAYLVPQGKGWAVRVVSANGGSSAPTIAAGAGALPEQLLWSPSSSLFALASPTAVTVTNLSHGLYRWSVSPEDRVLGWTPDGRALLIWNTTSHRVGTYLWSTGAMRSTLPGKYPARPLLAPDGKRMAFSQGRFLHIMTWKTEPGWSPPERVSLSSPAQCTPQGWSDDSTRLLLRCGSRLQVRGQHGGLLAEINLPPTTWVSWAPGSDRSLLLYRRGAIWVRSLTPRQAHRIVLHAEPVVP